MLWPTLLVLSLATALPVMSSNMSIVEVMVNYYGPIAFGIAMLIVLWRVVVAPTLERNALDIDALQVVTNTLKEVSMILDGSVKSLSNVVDRLERMEQRNGQKKAD